MKVILGSIARSRLIYTTRVPVWKKKKKQKGTNINLY